MKTKIPLFFIVVLLFLYAPYRASACPVGEYSSAYNSMCLCDNDYTDTSSMDLESIEYFLQIGNGKQGSFLYGKNGLIYDVDGTLINPAQIIYQAAQDNEISPQVILNMLQKENSACTTPTRLKTSVLNFILGCPTPSTN